MADSVPRYAAKPLLRFLAYWKESTKLLHSAMRGISMMRAMPNTLAVLIKTRPPNEHTDPDKDAQEIAEAKEAAAFAEKECKSEFPLMHAHTLVGCWGALQASVEDMLIGILLNEPGILGSKVFAKIRIPLAEFQVSEEDERMRIVIDELKRGHGRRQGIDFFELMLQPFGLSGEVESETRKLFWEMHHVRNAIVHRNSFADRRLSHSCPWMGIEPGTRVVVSHNDLARYGGAMCRYVTDLARRLARRYDVNTEDKDA
jgi:hypothetical protein